MEQQMNFSMHKLLCVAYMDVWADRLQARTKHKKHQHGHVGSIIARQHTLCVQKLWHELPCLNRGNVLLLHQASY
jgi:hypothetical protein